jgi:hypothetical protein
MAPKVAVAYRLPSRLLIHSESRTGRGVWIAVEPFAVIPLPADLEQLGGAALAGLKSSASEIPDPADWGKVTEELVAEAGLRSYRELQRNASLCRIEQTAEAISIVPHHNGGVTGDGRGFHSLPDRSITLQSAPPAAELGRQILRCLDRCT